MSKTISSNIQHAWSILCSGVSIDRQTNNLSLFNIIEQIKIPKNRLVEAEENGVKKLAVPMAFNLVTLWRRVVSDTVEEAEVEISLVDPNGGIRKISEYKLNFPAKIQRIRVPIQWAGIKTDSSGVHIFKISLKENRQKSFKEVGEAYLNIEILPDEKVNPDKIEKIKIPIKK